MNNAIIRSLGIVATAAFVFAGSAISMDEEGEGRPAPKKKAPPPLEEITLTGTLSKTEKEAKDGKISVTYTLIDANNVKTQVPRPRAQKDKKGQPTAEAINLDDFVDKQVVIKGKAQISQRGGKKSVTLKQVTSIIIVDGDGPHELNDGHKDEDMDGDMGEDMW